jgi:hypothetical protein
LLKAGDVLGVVAGTRQASGATNFMRLHLVTSEDAQAALPKLKGSAKKARKKTRVPRRTEL